jgi:hypothetical protein
MRRPAAAWKGSMSSKKSQLNPSFGPRWIPRRRDDEPGKPAAAGRIRVRTFALEVAAPRSNPLMLRRRISGRAGAFSTQLRAHFQPS